MKRIYYWSIGLILGVLIVSVMKYEPPKPKVISEEIISEINLKESIKSTVLKKKPLLAKDFNVINKNDCLISIQNIDQPIVIEVWLVKNKEKDYVSLTPILSCMDSKCFDSIINFKKFEDVLLPFYYIDCPLAQSYVKTKIKILESTRSK